MKFISTLVICTLAATFAYAAGNAKAEGDFANEATETMDAAASAPAPKAEKKADAKSDTKAESTPKKEEEKETPAAPATQAEAAATKTDAKPSGKYEGLWTFDWKRLTKCQFIGPVVNALLSDSHTICKKSEKGTMGPISCKVDEKREYLIFRNKEDCRVEYDEQLKASP